MIKGCSATHDDVLQDIRVGKMNWRNLAANREVWKNILRKARLIKGFSDTYDDILQDITIEKN